ncbi:MAG: M14 family zinc carboxypeptidase [Planctomycetota bacterium]
MTPALPHLLRPAGLCAMLALVSCTAPDSIDPLDAPSTQPATAPATRPAPLEPVGEQSDPPTTQATQPEVTAASVYDDIPTLSSGWGGRSVVGHSIEGRAIHAYTFPGRTDVAPVFLLGGIHGSEPDSARLTELWIERVAQQSQDPTAPTVVAVPFANPDGLILGKRHNLNGVDLNRNFPADNFRARERYGAEPLSQPEARAVHDLIASLNPGVILAIHQPLLCVDHDGPGSVALAEKIAAATDLPVKKLGARPGSLGSWAGEVRGAVVITLELPPVADTPRSEAELWARYGPAFDETLRFAQTLPNPNDPTPTEDAP